MRSLLFAGFALILSLSCFSQRISGLDSIGTRTNSDNIYSRPVAGDSLASSFCIVIKKEVKAHYHAEHSEHVIVLEGDGMMRVGDSLFDIHANDAIFIPKRTVHAVTSTGRKPLKVLSIQAPAFDGRDRVFVK